MYSGNIKGVGHKLFPSIEDKIARFYDKSSHVFVEPETEEFIEAYPSGLSTSFFDVQDFIHSIAGFENAVVKPGYAIEYDLFTDQQTFT